MPVVAAFERTIIFRHVLVLYPNAVFAQQDFLVFFSISKKTKMVSAIALNVIKIMYETAATPTIPRRDVKMLLGSSVIKHPIAEMNPTSSINLPKNLKTFEMR